MDFKVIRNQQDLKVVWSQKEHTQRAPLAIAYKRVERPVFYLFQ